MSASKSVDYEPMQSTSTPFAPESVQEWQAPAGAVVIQGVPAYIWYYGCGPTAVGMVVGYYDAHGFDDLVPGDASSQTEYVFNMIASPGHISDYANPIDYWSIIPDRSTLGGAHASDSVADFMHTSWSSDSNAFGWSWSDMVDDAFSGYVNWVNPTYKVSSSWVVWNGVTWDRFVHEIDSQHPVVFLVDSDGNGFTDHFVTALGYASVGGINFYGCYDTWDFDIHWYPFARMAKGQSFGIYDATILEITKDEAYSVSKTTSQGTSEISWTVVADQTRQYALSLDNNGFKSAVVEVHDITDGTSKNAFHQNMIMRSLGAYPFGWSSTGSVQMEAAHTYVVTVGSLDGPVGSYIVAYPTST